MFTDEIQVTSKATLTKEEYPRSSGRAQCNHKGL